MTFESGYGYDGTLFSRASTITLLALSLAGGPLAASTARAAEIMAAPNDYIRAIRTLRPGDTLRLLPGVYRNGLPLHDIQGEAARPITVEGDATGLGSVLLGSHGKNTISIKNAAYITVRSMLLDGAGIPVDAIKAEGTSKFAHHITLERLTIINHNTDQSIVGISTKCPAWGWVIRDNVIVGAGTGIYLGNSDGSAPFVGGLIEHNLIVDSMGYNLQIKHQTSRPLAIGMPVGPMQTVIRRNVFSKAKGSAAGHMARPNVLLGHFPLTGLGQDDSYSVYGNVFYENAGDALLQAEGDVSIVSNIFMNSYGDAVRLMPHKAVPRRVDIAHNTVLARGAGITVRGGDRRFAQVVRANAVFASQPLVGGEQQHNVTAPYAMAPRYLLAPFARPGRLDFSPRADALKINPEPTNNVATMSQSDYFARPFREPTAGAVASGLGTPWLLDLAVPPRKPCSSSQECSK